MDVQIHDLSAVEMAVLLRSKKISPREVMEAHLQRIEQINPKVNAIVTLTPWKAPADGPLYGLPVAHKDLIDTRGVRTTYGSPLFENHVPDGDELIVERMRAAGALMIGKTNTPEFGAGSQTFNPVFGATKNPYDPTKTCGGSSGGSTVALACGMTALATGTDVGGSLRNPAAFSNVVGMRPSHGRIPNPKAALAMTSYNVLGVMGRTVADVALQLSATAGPDIRDPLSIDEPGEIFAQPLDRDFKGTKIAWFRDLGGVPFDHRVREVVNQQLKTFEALGCIVEEAEPDFTPAETAFRILRAHHSAAQYGPLLKQHPNGIKATLKAEIEAGLKLTGKQIVEAEAARVAMWRGFQAFLTKYDYFVLPTTQVPPFDIDQPHPTEIGGTTLETYIDWMKSCWYISVTGNPAISVPGGFTDDGLPIGIQIVGRCRADFAVLQIAHAFEQATGFGQRPHLFA